MTEKRVACQSHFFGFGPVDKIKGGFKNLIFKNMFYCGIKHIKRDDFIKLCHYSEGSQRPVLNFKSLLFKINIEYGCLCIWYYQPL